MTSAKGTIIHTPVTPKKRGNIAKPSKMRTIVLLREMKIAENDFSTDCKKITLTILRATKGMAE